MAGKCGLRNTCELQMTIEQRPRHRRADRDNLEAACNQRESLLAKARRLLANYTGPAVVVDPDGQPLIANESGSQWLGRLTAREIPAIDDLRRRAFAAAGAMNEEISDPGLDSDQLLDISVIPVFDGQAALLLLRDMTLERNLRAALTDSRQRYKDLVEVSSDFSWETGAEGSFTFISPRGALGHGASDLIGCRPEALMSNAGDYDPLPFHCRSPMDSVEVWLRRADGGDACVLISSLPMLAANGAIVGARGVCRDVTDERDREAALSRIQNRERLVSYVTQAIREQIEPRDMVTAAAEATARSLGAAGCGILWRASAGSFMTAALFGEAVAGDSLETRLADQIEETAMGVQMDVGGWHLLWSASYHQQAANGAIAIWRSAAEGDWSEGDKEFLADIAGQLGIVNEQISHHERVLLLSRSDGMTGLLNRRTFFGDDLPRRLSRLRRTEQIAALFYIDMDNFKAVNGVHGHGRGDEAILKLRDILIEHSRPRDVIARLGGDEFAMWLDGITIDVAHRRAKELLVATAALLPYSGDASRPLGVSIGIAMYDPASGESLDNLVARADGAMYTAKRNGKGSLAIAPSSDGTGAAPL